MKINNSRPIVREFEPSHGSTTSYIFGFVGSLILTLVSYFAVTQQWFENTTTLVNFIICLAVTQFILQVMLFLHLGKESGSRWNMTVFLFMLLVIIVLVFGSIWIMKNLDYNMMNMSPAETEKTIIEGEAINKTR